MSSINPEQHKNLPSLDEKVGASTSKKIAAGIAGIGLAAGAGIFGYNQLSSDEAPRPEDTTSAPVDSNSVEQADSKSDKDLTPVESLGIIQRDYDKLNVMASEADIERALEPVPASTPIREAALEMSKKINVYYLSGEWDFDTGRGGITDQSIVVGDEILSTVFGSEMVYGPASTQLDYLRNSRHDIGCLMGYYNTDRGLQTNAETGNREYATTHYSWTIESQQGNSFSIITSYDTNLKQMNTSDIMPDASENYSMSRPQTVTLEQVDGYWQVSDLTSR